MATAKEIHEEIDRAQKNKYVDYNNDAIRMVLAIQESLLAHLQTVTTALLELQRGQFSSGRPSMSIETQAKLQEWQGEE